MLLLVNQKTGNLISTKQDKKRAYLIDRLFFRYLVGRERFERSTNGLKVRCSTS